MSGWIAVDLDGTLAVYDGWVSEEHIGEPIPRMVERVKGWIAEGKDVRIFTARVDGGEVAIAMGNAAGERFRDVQRIKGFIDAWCIKHIGRKLPITNRKDYGMIELWDDRCVQVVPNTGQTLLEHFMAHATPVSQRAHDQQEQAPGSQPLDSADEKGK